MKIQPKTALVSVLAVVLLTACGQDETDTTASAQSRFNLVNVEYETCIFDNSTGLLWAGKTDVAGLHDYRNTYTWYDPGEAHGELDYRGAEDGGECSGSTCDTWHYLTAVNETGHCGHNDWRMPAKDELFSISDLGLAANPPTIDTEYFSFSQTAEYWSANDYSFQWDAAWAWNFQFGHDRVDWKKTPKYVRLVRGEAAELQKVKE